MAHETESGGLRALCFESTQKFVWALVMKMSARVFKVVLSFQFVLI